MASEQNPPEDPGHTETEDETIAAKKKRSRRVSFADIEITSVHIFNRDDDHSDSTPPSDPKPLDGTDSRVKSHEFDRTGLFAELGVRSNDSPSAFDDKEEEGEVSAEGKSFFKPAETPSPGSSTAGSAFSNDTEDNYFGPVSSAFIRPPRLSDSSAASDENHDITMDSTSFSVHFRSLARSDFGGDIKTPTRTHLAFEEKTPTPSIAGTHPGSLMVVTNATKFSQESSVSLGSGESDGKDSNAMSLVGEDARSYGYGRLSPSLDAIFAEESNDLHNVSPSHLPIHESGSTSECGGGKKDMKEAGSNEMDKTMLTEEVMKDSSGVDERSSDLSVHPHINSYKQPVEANKESTEGADKMTGENIGVSDIIVGTPQSTSYRSLQHGSICYVSDDRDLKDNLLCDAYTSTDVGRSSDGVLHGSPLPGSISMSYVKKKETCSADACSPAKFSTLTPVTMGSKTLLSRESQQGLSFSSLQKSITRLKCLDRSSSPLKRGSEALKLRLRNFQSANSSHNTPQLESGIDVYSNHVDTPVAHFKHLSHDQKDIQNRLRSNLDSCGSETPCGIKTISNLSQNVVTATAVGNGECQEGGLFRSVSCKDKPSEVTAMTSPFKYFELQKEVMQLDLVSNSPPDIPFNTEAGPPVKIILNKMDVSETSANCSLYISPAERLEKRSAEGKDNQSHKGGDLKQHSEFSKLTSAVSEQNQTSPETAISGGCLIYNVGDVHSFSPESMRSLKGSPFEKLPVDIIEYSCGEASVSSPSQNNCINVYDYQKDSFHSENLFLAVSHTKKRTAEVLGDRDRNSKLAKIIYLEDGRSDACGDGIYLESSTFENERGKIEEDTALTKWDVVLNKFSEETRDLLGPVVHQLDHRGMNMMEDLLDYLRKTKNYEMLGFEMQSQKFHNQSGTLLKKRSAETLSLLYKVAYEKAQLRLSSLKRERLQKMARDLSSGIQDIQKLKRNYGENIYPPLAKDPKVGFDCHSCSTNNVLKDEAVGTLAGMRQEYEMLDEKTKSLADLLRVRCKINGEESDIDTIESVKSYLKKKMHCRLVHQDLQPWRVANFASSLGSHNIFLDYLGFICQRITVTGNPISLIVTNKLEDRRIEETFPNMNACSAFSYVFNEEATKKISSSTRLADKTQITSFLLWNLLDVVVELQAARLDIKELIKATFHPPSGGQLDLLLSFVDTKSCQKVTISLDMTCLKRGIYPSEVIPHHVEILKYETPHKQSSLSTKVEGAAEGLKFGFQRIVRLCRCFAQVVSSSSSR